MKSSWLTLNVFNSEENQKLTLSASLDFFKNDIGQFFELQFSLQDPTSEYLENFESFLVDQNRISRADEIWKQNCFELFLKPVNQKSYYEFNFGLSPVWNCYYFSDYRSPVPPRESSDFAILNAEWNQDLKFFKVIAQNKSPYRNFEAGITAVLKKNQQSSYFALEHAGAKPDFHLEKSFILKRSWE